MKKPIPIDVPATARWTSYLYANMKPTALHQTMAVVRLSNGFMVELGWFPENQADGRYFIVVSLDGEDVMKNDTKTQDPFEAAGMMSRIVRRFDGWAVPVSNTSETRQSLCVG